MATLIQRYETLFFSLLYLAVRYAHIPAFFSADGFTPQGTDPFLRLYLIEKKVRQGLKNISFDPNIAFPDGGHIKLAPGMEYLFAVPAKLLGLTQSTDIAMLSMLLLPLLGLPLIWLIAPIEKKWTDRVWVRTTIYLCLIFFPTIIGFTSIGRIDHTVLGSVLFLWTWYLIAHRDHRYTPGCWMVTFGLGACFWPHTWVLAPWAGLVVLILDTPHARQWSVRWAGATIISVLPMFLTDYYRDMPLSPYQYSYFTTAVLAGVAALTFCINYVRTAHKSKKDHITALLVVGVALAAFAFTWEVWWGFAKSLGLFFTASQNTLRDTAEAQNIFWLLSWVDYKTDVLWLLLLPVAMVWAWYKRQARGLILFTVLPLILCFQQIRFANVLYPLALIVLLCSFWQWLTLQKPNWAVKRKTLVFVGCLAVALLPFAGQLGHAKPNHHPFYLSVKKASQFIDQHANRGPYTRQASGVIAPWSYGYWLMYYAHLPVVANPAQGHTATEVKEFYTSTTRKQYDAFLKKYPARYLFALDDPSQLGKDYKEYLTKKEDLGSAQAQVKKKKILRTILGRFFTLNALTVVDHPMGVWRVVYASPYIFREGQEITSLKVFERVPGAQITFKTEHAEPLYLSAKIDLLPKEVFRYDLPSLYQNGAHQWTVPYGKVEEGGVTFSGTYRIETRDGQLVGKVDVSEKDIYAGTNITLNATDMEKQ